MRRAPAQVPKFATLNIEYANAVSYIDDIGDRNKFASSPVPPTLNAVKNFVPFVVIGDIVSVNGAPVKGVFVDRGLDAAQRLDDLGKIPGHHLEALTGDRLGQHSIRVNRKYRICFIWRGQDAYDVEIVDYH